MRGHTPQPLIHQRFGQPLSLKIRVATDRLKQAAFADRIDPVNEKGPKAAIRSNNDQFALNMKAGRTHHTKIFAALPRSPERASVDGLNRIGFVFAHNCSYAEAVGQNWHRYFPLERARCQKVVGFRVGNITA